MQGFGKEVFDKFKLKYKYDFNYVFLWLDIIKFYLMYFFVWTRINFTYSS